MMITNPIRFLKLLVVCSSLKENTGFEVPFAKLGSRTLPTTLNSIAERYASLTSFESMVEEAPRTSIMTAQTGSGNKWLQKWRIRLDTIEDKFDVHKWTAGIYTLSALFMLGIGATRDFASIPDFLQLPTMIWLTSATIQSVTSLQMNANFRKNDPVVKKGFDNMSYAMLLTLWLGLYVSPFAPKACNNFWIGNSLTLMVLLKGFITGLEEVIELPKTFRYRTLRSKEQCFDFGQAGDLASYAFAIVFGFLFTPMAMYFLLSPENDRTWLLANSNYPTGELFPIYGFYDSILLSLSIGYQALLITLRDKKLMKKDQEQAGILILNSIAAVASAKQFGLF